MARTRADRYPFDPQDGVKAVEGYALALSCFEAAIDPESVVTAVQEASALQTRIDEDYHAHRVRLDRSIEQKDYQAALVEVRTLIALVRHREGPYLALLEQTERRLRLRVAESKTKR